MTSKAKRRPIQREKERYQWMKTTSVLQKETQLPVKKNRGKRQQEKAMQTRTDNRNLNF